MPSFPTYPTIGEIFTFGQYSWQWTGTYWQPYVSSSTSFTAITSVGNGYSIINNTTGTTLELRSFSGVNITIITGTSGTLTFSASTGGGGGGGSGSSGTSGINGSSGTSGNSGSSGTSGNSGSSGTSGNSGSSGTSGNSGSSGTSGENGSSGTSGENGTSGNSGSSGTSGENGSSGTSGTSPDISGTINYIPKFTGATSLGNSLIYDDGTNLGIGTTSPSAKLDIITPSSSSIGLRISGDSTTDLVRITQTGSGAAFRVEDEANPDSTPFIITGDGKVYIGTTDATTSILNVGGNSHFYGNIFINGTANRAIQNSTLGRALINFATVGDSYFNNGNLGIGTISPGSKLDINSSTGTTIGLRVTGGTSVDMVRITQTGSGNAIVVEDETNPDATPFVVAADGRVGIGTTSPSAKLDINVSTGGTIGVRISGDSSSDMLRITQTGSGNAILVEDSSNPDSTPFVVTSGGTVGIGTTTPSYFLEAISTGGVDAVMMFDGGTAANSNLVSRADTTQKLPVIVMSDRNNAYSILTSFYIALDRASGASWSTLFTSRNDAIYVNNYTDKGHHFVTNNGGSKGVRMSILGNGNVGIGTTSPSANLHVTGNALIGGTLTATTISGNSLTLSNSASTISLNNTTQQQIRFYDAGRGTPSYNSYSAGAKIIFTDNISSNSSGHAIGVDAGSLWYGADLAGNGHDWYAGTRKLASLIGSSGFQLIGLGGPTTTAMSISGTASLGSKGGAGYMDFLQVINNWSGATNVNKWFRTNPTGGLEILNNAYTATILTISDSGIMAVAGGNLATTSSNDGQTNYLTFGSNNTQIYDDGNTHIHSRSSNQSMWINTNGGQINIGTQTTVSGGALASAITMGSSTVAKAYLNVYGGKTYTIGTYGYLFTGGAGTGGGTTATYGIYTDNRIEAVEFDATSDERLKNIKGNIQLNDAINLVNNIKPIKFTWKNKESEGVKAGYSAQQVVKSGFGHLVSQIKNEELNEVTDNEGFTSPKGMQLTMSYDQVTPYHGVVIKHLLEKIEQLEKRISDLENK